VIFEQGITCFLCTQTSLFWIANLLRMFRWSASRRRRGRWRRADKKPFSFRRCWESRWIEMVGRWLVSIPSKAIKSSSAQRLFVSDWYTVDWLFVWIWVLQKVVFYSNDVAILRWKSNRFFTARWAVLEKLLGTSRELQTTAEYV